MEFDQAFDILIGHEGGYVNHPHDPGGETKFGITRRSYPDLDIASLTVEDAKKIYRADFWQRLNLDKLPTELRFHIFDAAVNSGRGNAARFLQRALGIADDGIIGPITLQWASQVNPLYLVMWYSGERLSFMTRLSTWRTFGKGWVRRIADNLRVMQ